mmetsp:Transcript_23441/g.69401  ORF Transcript_23441/g.69401 Transcript_23441/m.69401 type:complete len:264 (-) Transcript_23441:297-1088(-)
MFGCDAAGVALPPPASNLRSSWSNGLDNCSPSSNGLDISSYSGALLSSSSSSPCASSSSTQTEALACRVPNPPPSPSCRNAAFASSIMASSSSLISSDSAISLARAASSLAACSRTTAWAARAASFLILWSGAALDGTDVSEGLGDMQGTTSTPAPLSMLVSRRLLVGICGGPRPSLIGPRTEETPDRPTGGRVDLGSLPLVETPGRPSGESGSLSAAAALENGTVSPLEMMFLPLPPSLFSVTTDIFVLGATAADIATCCCC